MQQNKMDTTVMHAAEKQLVLGTDGMVQDQFIYLALRCNTIWCLFRIYS